MLSRIIAAELIGELNNARLTFRIETLDLFDDLICGHDAILTHMAPTFNLQAPKVFAHESHESH
jgi:hypothetical protein